MRIINYIGAFIFINLIVADDYFYIIINRYTDYLNHRPLTRRNGHKEIIAGDNIDTRDLGEPIKFKLNDDGSLEDDQGNKVGVKSSSEYEIIQDAFVLDNEEDPVKFFSLDEFNNLSYNGSDTFARCVFRLDKYYNYLTMNSDCPYDNGHEFRLYFSSDIPSGCS